MPNLQGFYGLDCFGFWLDCFCFEGAHGHKKSMPPAVIVNLLKQDPKKERVKLAIFVSETA